MPYMRPRDDLAEAEAEARAEVLVSLSSILNSPEACPRPRPRALANIDHVDLAEADPRAEASLSASILNFPETCCLSLEPSTGDDDLSTSAWDIFAEIFAEIRTHSGSSIRRDIRRDGHIPGSPQT